MPSSYYLVSLFCCFAFQWAQKRGNLVRVSWSLFSSQLPFRFFQCLISGHYLLTEMLLEKMVETAAKTGIQGRIINVSSMIHNWVKRDTFRFNEMLNPKRYGKEKIPLHFLCNQTQCQRKITSVTLYTIYFCAVIMALAHIHNQSWPAFCMPRKWQDNLR